MQEMVGDSSVLRDGLINPARPNIQIAQRVGSDPVIRVLLDDLRVLGNGSIEPSLTEQLFDFSQCLVATGGHRSRGRSSLHRIKQQPRTK